MELDKYAYERQRRARAQLPNIGIHDRLDHIQSEMTALSGYAIINACILAMILWRVW